MKKHLVLSDFPVKTKIKVAWGEMDALGHVNNIIFFRYFETARIAYFQETEIISDEEPQLGSILGETSCKFISPIYFPSDLWTCASVVYADSKVIEMSYGIFSDDGKICFAVGSGRIMAFDYAKKARAEIPKTWLQRIQSIQS